MCNVFTDTIREPMKIGCAEGGSQRNHGFTASTASDLACPEQLYYLKNNPAYYNRKKV